MDLLFFWNPAVVIVGCAYCAFVAAEQKHSAAAWALVGMIVPLLAIVVLSVLPSREAKEAKASSSRSVARGVSAAKHAVAAR